MLKKKLNEDREVEELVKLEEQRQKETLELIPSENYVSPAVREATGSVFTNKYSEGYPGKRYYGGQVAVDALETLTQKRALEIFINETERENWHVNVQPYSGSPANLAALLATAGQGGVIMGLKLTHGGHLTHGHKVSYTGKIFNSVQYEIDPNTELLDYTKILEQARQIKPKVIISGATAYPRVIDFQSFQKIADEVGALHMADISHVAGLIAGDVHPSPFPFTHLVTTTTHKTLRGPRGAMIFCQKQFADAVDKAVFPGLQGGPHENVIAAKAVAFGEILSEDFREYAKQIVSNAKALAQELLAQGFRLVTGGTDNHLLLVDLQNKGVTGKEAEELLDQVGIIVNKNTIPNEPRSPFDPSGIRLGTPAITSRGMKENEMRQIGTWIGEAIESKGNEANIDELKGKVRELAQAFPPPGF